jgi:hypothetical protein
MHGGIEGMSGNQGYPSTVKAVVNICGALGDTAWMQAGDVPLLSFHGNADGTVPYGYATIAVLGFPLLKVSGSSVVAVRANHLGIPNCMETWLGADHVPEVGTSASNLAYYDSVITITRNFLEHFTCGVAIDCNKTLTPQVLGVAEHFTSSDINVYPNPANNGATIDLSAFQGHEVSIELFDVLGQKVKSVSSVKAADYVLTRDHLYSGFYYLNVIADGKVYSKKLMFQ